MKLMTPDISWLANEYAAALRGVGTSITGQQSHITVHPFQAETGRVAAAGEWLWWSQSFSILPGPAIWIGALRGSWTALERLIRNIQGAAQAGSEDTHASCRELIAQSSSVLVQSLSRRFNIAVDCLELDTALPPESVRMTGVTLTFPEPDTRIDLTLAFEPALLQKLSDSLRDSVTGAVSEPEALPQPIANLRVRVRVALGRFSLPLGEIFKMTVGSVIELNRSIDEPVDVMINDQVIARGSVITCDGNYGVKILSKLLDDGTGTGRQ